MARARQFWKRQTIIQANVPLWLCLNFNVLMQPSLDLIAGLLSELMQLALAAPMGLLRPGRSKWLWLRLRFEFVFVCQQRLCFPRRVTFCWFSHQRAHIVSHRHLRGVGRAPLPVSLLPAGGPPPASTLINSPISSLHTWTHLGRLASSHFITVLEVWRKSRKGFQNVIIYLKPR